ncbi:MAG: lipopolysaccharide biosynthesis protein [Clostridia bacterium]|nr:lipopolysaccharide biosynthesis protein [Clostridia bacterium]
MSESLKEKSINSFVWKTAQSVCTLGMTFVIQLVLARILAPEDFGVIAITTVFMTLANTVIETSFSSSVIQRDSLDNKLTSSIFFANLVLSLAVYAVLFFVAPAISGFYKEPILVSVLRVQGLRVVISGLYSVPQAFLNRKMKFRQLFFCSLAGSVAQAVTGLAMAYADMGVWALVVSTLASSIVAGVLMIIIEPWKPDLFFSFRLVKDALSFSSNVLAIRVVRKLFYNIRVLAIGKVYDTQILGFFNKGFQFPSTAMTVVDGSLTSVAFTSLSKLQNDKEKLLSSLRQYVRILMFICTPMMVGMALVAEPMVVVLLTEKWLDCVPFVQIVCFTQLLVPLNVKTTAFEALGDSGTSMILHVSSVILSLVLLVAAIPFSAHIMVLSGFVSSLILHIAVSAAASKKLDYKIFDQIKDALCGMIPTVAMAAAVIGAGFIDCGVFAKLCIQIIFGVAAFVVVAFISKNKVFYSILDIAKKKILRRK